MKDASCADSMLQPDIISNRYTARNRTTVGTGHPQIGMCAGNMIKSL